MHTLAPRPARRMLAVPALLLCTLPSSARADDAKPPAPAPATIPPLASKASPAGGERAAAPSDAARNKKLDEAVRRATLSTYHRSMGITTWISVAAATTLGTLRYANVIGFGEPLCAPGNSPIFGRSFGCGVGLRVWHLASATFTVISYAATRTLAGMMPDPYDVGSHNSAFAARLRAHRALSWVHLPGMIALPILGAATAGTHDQGTKDALGTAHLVVGYATLGAVTAAASLMIFGARSSPDR